MVDRPVNPEAWTQSGAWQDGCDDGDDDGADGNDDDDDVVGTGNRQHKADKRQASDEGSAILGRSTDNGSVKSISGNGSVRSITGNGSLSDRKELEDGGQDRPSVLGYPSGQGYPSGPDYPNGLGYPRDQGYHSGQRDPSGQGCTRIEGPSHSGISFPLQTTIETDSANSMGSCPGGENLNGKEAEALLQQSLTLGRLQHDSQSPLTSDPLQPVSTAAPLTGWPGLQTGDKKTETSSAALTQKTTSSWQGPGLSWQETCTAWQESCSSWQGPGDFSWQGPGDLPWQGPGDLSWREPDYSREGVDDDGGVGGVHHRHRRPVALYANRDSLVTFKPHLPQHVNL